MMTDILIAVGAFLVCWLGARVLIRFVVGAHHRRIDLGGGGGHGSAAEHFTRTDHESKGS